MKPARVEAGEYLLEEYSRLPQKIWKAGMNTVDERPHRTLCDGCRVWHLNQPRSTGVVGNGDRTLPVGKQSKSVTNTHAQETERQRQKGEKGRGRERGRQTPPSWTLGRGQSWNPDPSSFAGYALPRDAAASPRCPCVTCEHGHKPHRLVAEASLKTKLGVCFLQPTSWIPVLPELLVWPVDAGRHAGS